MIGVIVALDKNYLIGKNNQIPWNVPEDLALFKEKTTRNFIIMGRKTFESIGRPLPNRVNIVISNTMENDFDFQELTFEELLNKTVIFHSIEEGISFCKKFSEKDIFIIGGAKIYQEVISKNIFDKLFISHIKGEFQGDTYFPKIDFKTYKNIFEKEYKDFIYREYTK